MAGALLMGIIFWNILLKQEVNAKTVNLEGVVAELKKSGVELRHAQAILQAAMDCSPAGIAIADAPEGTLRYVNDAGLLIRGGDRQSVVNGGGIDQYVASWQLLDLDGRELRADEVPLARAIIYGEPSSREFIIRRKEGDDRIVEGNAAPIKDETGTVTAGIVIFTDITDRIHSERLKGLLSAIIDSSSDAIIGKTLDGVITSWNQAAERIFGYSDQEMLGQRITRLIPPRLEAEEQDILKKIINGEHIDHYETERVRKDGTLFPISATISPIRDESGTIIGVSKIARDITDRKKADEIIRTSLKEKEILLKEIHHRVKNNLQIIASLLKLQSRFSSDERLNAVFQECQDRIRAMAGVHSLLYRSKNFTRINFGDCIRETTAELLRSYLKSPANILPDIHAEEVMLSIDEAIPCSLIINELVTNAVKYAFTETGHGEIKIELTETEQGIRLLVKDNGVGFPPELNFRETETLGLQLVNMLVKQLDGSIEQSVDGGTAYAIIFAQKNISAEVPHEGQ